MSVDIFSYGSHIKLLWTSTQTEGHTFELVNCCTKAGLMKSTLVRTLILPDPASAECPTKCTGNAVDDNVLNVNHLISDRCPKSNTER